MKHSLSRSLAILSALLSAGMLAGFYALQCAPAVHRAGDQSVHDSVQAITALAQPGLVKAWETRDDISLLIHIERIARMEGVRAAFLLDPDGTVIMHNKTAEWGRPYAGAAAVSRRNAAHLIALPDGMLYATPIASSATLGVEFAVTEHNARRTRAAQEAAAAGALFVICSAVIFFLLTRILIDTPFAALLAAVRAAAPGSTVRIPPMPRNQFGDLAVEINRLLDTGAAGPAHMQQGAPGTGQFFARIGHIIAETGRGVIILDAANTLLFISEKAAARFGISAAESLHRHVLEAITDRALIALIERAARAESTAPAVRESRDSSTVTCHIVRSSDGTIQNIFLLVD